MNPRIASPRCERDRSLSYDRGVSPVSTSQLAAPTPAPAQKPNAEASERRKRIALVVIATTQLMVVLDATIVNIALPHIQTALDFSTTGLSWVLNAYTL